MAKVNDEKIQKVLEDVQITPCDEIVVPPSANGGMNSNVDCGQALNMDAIVADTQIGTGWAWSRDMGLDGNQKGSHFNDRIVVNGKDITNQVSVRHCEHLDGGPGYTNCTASVAGHLVAGGFMWTGPVGKGLKMRDELKRYGVFKKLDINISLCNTNNKIKKLEANDTFQPGDICCQSHATNPNKCGHACIWNGKNWVSDFVQNWCLVYDEGNRNRIYSEVCFYRHQSCKEAEENNNFQNKNGIYAWLGDSQSADGTFPKTVQSELEIPDEKFKIFAQEGASSAHFLDTNKSSKLKTRCLNTMGCANNCNGAYKWLLTNKPQYCFVALGHNEGGTRKNKLNELFDKLKDVGINVILIKMFPAPNCAAHLTVNVMRETYKDVMQGNIYCQVDLTNCTDLVLSNDHLHATTESRKKIGKMVADKIKEYQKSGEYFK